MTEDTPSSSDSAQAAGDNPSSNPSAFLAPSDFLPRLPPSTELPSAIDEDAPTTSEAPTSASRVQIDSQGRTLNPRSCVTCRKRKVKCDKLHPCSNCSRAHIECVFPSPGRAPRRVKKPGEGRDKEVLDRLKRLEGVMTRLGVDVVDDEDMDRDKSIFNHTRTDSHATVEGSGNANDRSNTVNSVIAENPQGNDLEFIRKTQWIDKQHKGRFENRFGRLVVNEGKSRYVNNSFWANLSSEVEDLKAILNQSSDDEDSLTTSPGSNTQSSSSHGFVFGFSSQNVDLLSLHPLPGQVLTYWNIYKDRVDPLCKVLHLPSLNPTVANAAANLSNLPRAFEALLFAIYYGATTSLPASDCLIQFGEEKSVLLARYQFALEQALARANFLTTEEMVVLQAFVIFLICLRRNSDARMIWTLTGLVVRIAQTIGIHRDGAHFGLSPFEVEMRRRLWWQVCILDTRASEDHGCDPTIIEQSFDTKLPLNINDTDISPELKEFPPERHGCTDMSFSLIRFEVSNTFRRINYIPPSPPKACGEYLTSVTLEDKEKWISECHKRLEERYLKHCDMSVPLYWVTATVARLMMSKMWLMVYHPFQRLENGSKISDETKDKLFITSLENMEYSLLLETESRTMKWGWLFKTYMQWHALAFCLSELCHRTTGDMVERAWKAVEKTRDGRWGVQISDETNTGHLWRPLKKLYRKAREARQRGLQEERYGKQHPINLPTRTYSPNANPMFGHPARPSPTRAPLSDAQLKRFSEGPAFGHPPLDKHTLLRTSPPIETSSAADPTLADASGIQTTMDATTSSEPSQLPPFLGVNGLCPGQGFMGEASNIDFGDFQPQTQQEQQRQQQQQQQQQQQSLQDMPEDPLLQNDLSLDPAGNMDPDLSSIMDTSGDLNWENWDQLVRQFGMDVDSGPAFPSANHGIMGGNSGGWNGVNNNGNLDIGGGNAGGGNVGAAGMNMRMGMGLTRGDWF